VTALEERATPATGFLSVPIDPPVMYVLGDLPAAPASSDGTAAKPIVRIDLMPAAGSTKPHAQEWSDIIVGDPAMQNDANFARKAPWQETDPTAPDRSAEDLALLEAEWAAMQQTS